MADSKKLDQIAEDFISFVPGVFAKLISQQDRELRIKPMKSHFQVLGILKKYGTLPTSEIGKRLCISKPNMTALIDKLIEEGKVERVQNKCDRRIVDIAITKQGRAFLVKQKNIAKGLMKKNLTQLNDKDLDALYKSLESIKLVLSKIKQ